jgi:hypothetical protein
MTDPAPFAARPWRALPDAALAAATVPTMLNAEERRLYLWLARDWARGEGAIVDLGCFAGGSAAILAEGQRQAGRALPVHAYDAFRISEPLKARFLYPVGIAPFEGEDMLPVAQALLAPWGTAVLHPGRIETQVWDGGPIEILAMDASKTAATMDAMAAAFLPAMVPGRGVVIQQDFLHWRQPWIAVQMFLLDACFEPVAHAPRDTVVFRCLRAPSAEEVKAATCARLDAEAMIGALRAMRDRLRPFGLGKQMRGLIDAVRANPGVRNAAAMKPPLPRDGGTGKRREAP